MYDTTAFRKGLKILINGAPWKIVEFQHVKPGKGGAFVRTRIKNLKTGQVIDKTFRSGDKVGVPDVEDIEATYMYADGTDFHFMNTETYETFGVPIERVGDTANFLIEETKVDILMFEGQAVDIQLPIFIVADIIQCDPGVAGNTATGATKPVTISTGYTLQVPLYIEGTDRLKIDTRDGKYVERVKS